MNGWNWLIRASRWSRNPPSTKRVMIVFGAVALCLVIVGADKLGLWPDWATAERVPRSLR